MKKVLPVITEKPMICSVRCPRKGPLGAEISLLVCEQLHENTPERCVENACDNADKYRAETLELRNVREFATHYAPRASVPAREKPRNKERFRSSIHVTRVSGTIGGASRNVF